MADDKVMVLRESESEGSAFKGWQSSRSNRTLMKHVHSVFQGLQKLFCRIVRSALGAILMRGAIVLSVNSKLLLWCH
jgi:hypothetical protein